MVWFKITTKRNKKAQLTRNLPKKSNLGTKTDERDTKKFFVFFFCLVQISTFGYPNIYPDFLIIVVTG